MAAEVKASLCKRNGEIKVFKEEAGVEESSNGKAKLDALIGSLMKVQKQVNEALTEIVEAERSTTNSKTNQEMNVDNEEEDDDDDDDSDDEDDGNNNSSSTELGKNNSYEPVSKKPKT